MCPALSTSTPVEIFVAAHLLRAALLPDSRKIFLRFAGAAVSAARTPTHDPRPEISAVEWRRTRLLGKVGRRTKYFSRAAAATRLLRAAHSPDSRKYFSPVEAPTRCRRTADKINISVAVWSLSCSARPTNRRHIFSGRRPHFCSKLCPGRGFPSQCVSSSIHPML